MDTWCYNERKEENSDVRQLFRLGSVSTMTKNDRLRWFGLPEHKDDEDD